MLLGLLAVGHVPWHLRIEVGQLVHLLLLVARGSPYDLPPILFILFHFFLASRLDELNLLLVLLGCLFLLLLRYHFLRCFLAILRRLLSVGAGSRLLLRLRLLLLLLLRRLLLNWLLSLFLLRWVLRLSLGWRWLCLRGSVLGLTRCG